MIIDRAFSITFMFFIFYNFYPMIKFMYDKRQHELILNTPIALFLGALALKMELVKFIFFVR